MKWNKILSVQFCQAAILALRDWAIEFETTNHFVYPGDKAPSEEQVDMHGFFLHCVHNEIRWHVIADYISKESVVVADGARLQQVAAAVSEHLPYSADEFIAKWSDTAYLNQLIEKYWFLTDDILDEDVMFPLEGYLYADTYYLTDNMTIEGFTEMCLDRMDGVLTERKDQIDASGFSVHQFLTLTSIVTKESRAEDQAKVAGVFINRLNDGTSLGSDVTVCYIFQEDRVDLKQSQLDSENPYNTRKFAGLPPGPICQVIDGAMDAVLNYEKSDNMFFFADENGVVHYYKDADAFYQGIEDEGLLHDE
jgi:UPF0755 protein